MPAVLAQILLGVAKSILNLHIWISTNFMGSFFTLIAMVVSVAGRGWAVGYWFHVWLAWMTLLMVTPTAIVSSWLLSHTATAQMPHHRDHSDEQEWQVVLELLLLSWCANRLWRSQVNTPLMFWLLQTLAGPTMLLSKLVLELGPLPLPPPLPPSPSARPAKRTPLLVSFSILGWPLVWGQFMRMIGSTPLPSVMALVNWYVQSTCLSLLILSVIEVNLVFNLRFAYALWVSPHLFVPVAAPRNKSSRSCALVWRIINLITGVTILVLATHFSLSFAWTLHLVWLAADL